jgi:maleate isomerase
MYGWRARIGLMIANSNTTMEPEFNRLAPDGVSVHAERIRVSAITVSGLSETEGEVARAARLLAPINARAYAYACTAANMAEGVDSDLQQAKIISDITGRPAVTASMAIYEAFAALGARKIAVATPYPEDLNVATRAYWQAAGFEVVDVAGVNLGGERSALEPFSSIPVSQVGLQHPATAYNLARMVKSAGADALLLSGANMRSIEVIEAVEQDLGLTCISSSTATIWAVLQAAGVRSSIPGAGRLLAEQPALGWKRVQRP